MAYLLLTITVIIWGGVFHIAGWALDRMPPLLVALYRFGLATPLLIAVVMVRGNWHWRLSKKLFLQLLVIGLFGTVFYNALFFWGLKLSNPLNAALLIAANPAFTALISRFWKKEKRGWVSALGMVLSFTGVGLILTKASLDTLLGLQFNTGDLLLLLATICWALYTIIGKDIMQEVTPSFAISYSLLLGLPFLAILAWVEISYLGFGQGADVKSWLSILYMAILGTALAFVFWYRGVNTVGPTNTALFVNGVPLAAFAIGAAIGIKPTLAQLLGGAFVIAGVVTSSRFSKAPRVRNQESN